MNYLDPYNFYFELPLYTPIEINNAEKLKDFSSLVNFDGKIDGYNIALKEQTTYKVEVSSRYDVGRYRTPAYFDTSTLATLTCLRTSKTLTFFFLTVKKEEFYHLIKVGQYPSIAALHIAQIKEYDKVLSKDKMKEFTKAIGLAANGVGIGSFIYLRRIFEYLLEEAHQLMKAKAGWDDKKYINSRVNERIAILQTELPEFLIEHKELYGILSKGIHELEEEECLKHFTPVRIGIELILDEKVERYEKKKRMETASKAIQAINSEIKKK